MTSAREKLPQRREADVLTVAHRRVDGAMAPFILTVGRYPTGAIGEVFIDSGKPTSDSAYLARDAALMISVALQHGVSIEALRHSVGRGDDGQPHTIIGTVLDVLADLEAVPA